MTEAASWWVGVGGAAGAGAVALCPAPGATGGCAGTAADVAAAGRILSVSRRISFTFSTIDSHSLFSAVTSMVAVAPVVAAPEAAPAPAPPPKSVDAVDFIVTFRDALR